MRVKCPTSRCFCLPRETEEREPGVEIIKCLSEEHNVLSLSPVPAGAPTGTARSGDNLEANVRLRQES